LTLRYKLPLRGIKGACLRHIILFCLCFSLMGGAASGVEIMIPHLRVKQGKSFDIPIIIDRADNLAGIKLVIAYDKGLLTFKEGNPSKSTRSLMCVINDKNPGRLIVVMAGAKGVSGKDLPLVILSFEANKVAKETVSTRLDILEYQLMSDQLKEVKGTVVVKPLDIIP